MNFVDLVAMSALLQYLFFGAQVGQARGKYGVHAPAMTGHEGFDRIYRVQMNTLELLIVLLPAMYAAARYWPAWAVAAAGVVYLVGRFIYWRAYIAAPASRGLGFMLSIGPVFTLVIATAAAIVLGKGAA